MIDTFYFWTNIFLLALGTQAIRFSVIALSHKIRITEEHKELFSYIPAAVLPALVAPMVFFHQGQVAWLLGKERLFVLALSTVVCFFFRNMIVTIGFGLISLYALTRL